MRDYGGIRDQTRIRTTFELDLRRRAGYFSISLRPMSHRALAAARLRWSFGGGDVLDGRIQPTTSLQDIDKVLESLRRAAVVQEGSLQQRDVVDACRHQISKTALMAITFFN
jgi:hypothetical protein